MALKQYKPTSPGQRGLVLVDKSSLSKDRPMKKLTEGLPSKSGRNNNGRITSRRRGGGHKRLYRKIDFKRDKIDSIGVVEKLEYDPNRTAFIALIKYEDEYRYIIAPQRLSVGDKISSGPNSDIKPGNALPMTKIPIGTIIHNIEMKPGKGGQLIRSAGTFAQLVGRDQGMAIIRLTSGEQRLILAECYATIGAVSNPDNSNQKLAKAGRNRWKGKRPSVRGVAMNPVDHPHGGGEGKTSGGRSPVSPWGQSAKGLKTRNNKRTNKYIILRRKRRK